MARWMGHFIDMDRDNRGEEFMISAGFPPEVAKKLGPSISEITFEPDGDSVLLTVSNPELGRTNKFRFKFGEDLVMEGKGIKVVGRYDWDEESRTLRSHYNTGETEYWIDFKFSEDYETIVKHRRTSTMETTQVMRRVPFAANSTLLSA